MKYENDLIGKLKSVMRDLPKLLNHPNEWESLIVNRRKPHTYRAWRMLDDNYRVCLHRFEQCSPEEAFVHPHPWPGAFIVLQGSYAMKVGLSSDRKSQPTSVVDTILRAGSIYSITNPLTWHSVQPLETCYSIMINGKPFENPHEAAPTTKGKDLDKMSEEDLKAHLDFFKNMDLF